MAATSPAPTETLRLAARSDETPDLVRLQLCGASAGFHAGFHTPGQYCEVHLPGRERPGYLAFASAPGDEDVEFLVGRGTDFGDRLALLASGAEVALGAPAGRGYPLAEVGASHLWLVGAGSGCGPLRSVARHLLDGAGRTDAGFEPGRLHLLFGARHRLPFARDVDRWADRGAAVHATLTGAPDGWRGHHGYVQEVLAELAPDLSDAWLLVCGRPELEQGVRAAAAKLGILSDRIATNY